MRHLLIPFWVFFALAIPTLASSATVTHSLNFEFSGGTDPAGASPWVNITFDDSFGDANTVRVTIANTNIVANEFNSAVYLNFDSSLDPTALSFTAVDNSASTPTISTGADAFKADGDGFFDILFDFPPPPGQPAAKFTAGEVVIYDIVYTSAISASSFDFLSAPGGGNGSHPAAAHIQGIAGGGSGWIGVPEPSLGFLVLLSAGMVSRRRPRLR